jgi:hypothetical protein
LEGGEKRTFLEDGDSVILTGSAEKNGYFILILVYEWDSENAKENYSLLFLKANISDYFLFRIRICLKIIKKSFSY